MAPSSPNCLRQNREASREHACCSCGVPDWAKPEGLDWCRAARVLKLVFSAWTLGAILLSFLKQNCVRNVPGLDRAKMSRREIGVSCLSRGCFKGSLAVIACAREQSCIQTQQRQRTKMPNPLRPGKTKLLASSDKTFSDPTVERCICTKVPGRFLTPSCCGFGYRRRSSQAHRAVPPHRRSQTSCSDFGARPHRSANSGSLQSCPVMAVFLLGKGSRSLRMQEAAN